MRKIQLNNYIDLLEKKFMVFGINSFSKNLRNEIKSNKKIYFYDKGVRDMIIGNFMMAERMKFLSYSQSNAKSYLWRTITQQGIYYV